MAVKYTEWLYGTDRTLCVCAREMSELDLTPLINILSKPQVMVQWQPSWEILYTLDTYMIGRVAKVRRKRVLFRTLYVYPSVLLVDS